MRIESIEQTIAEATDGTAIIFSGPYFDKSIVGISDDGRVIYDFDKMVMELAEDENISEEDALDFIEYNTIGALPSAGEYGPIILYPIYEEFLIGEDAENGNASI